MASDDFMVLTCLTMNPFDFGYCGDEVMYSTIWLVMNWAKSSEENGGPLSVVRLLGFPYCEKSCVNFCMTVSAVFVDILKLNWYLLNVSATSRYSLPLKLKESAARPCQGASVTSLGITS